MLKDTPLNFTLNKNEGCFPSITYTEQETGAVIDLTGYTAKIQIRKTLNSDEAVVELTTETGGGITITGADGFIEVDQSILEGLLAEVDDGDYVYDVFIIAPTTEVKTRLFGGIVTIADTVTRFVTEPAP